MGNVFRDGAESGDVLFWDINQSGAMTASTTVKRTGTYSYKMTSGLNAYHIIATPVTEAFFRVPFYIGGGETGKLFSWGIDGTELGSIRLNGSTRHLDAYVGASSVASGSTTINDITFYVMEIHIKIADASGDLEVKLDGVLPLEIDFSGDTKPDANTTLNNFGVLRSGYTTSALYYDDLAMNDTIGSVDNSWCGDGHIIALVPNANGDVTQLVGSDGNQTDNYLLVDELPYNSDTDYVVGSGIGQYDLYNLSASGLSSVTILRVWPESRSRKTNAEAGKIALMFKTNGVEYTQSGKNLLTSYTAIIGSGYLTNPQTGIAWTIAELDALQIGVKVQD